MEVAGDLTLQWVEDVGNVIHEEVICGLDEVSELVEPQEEVIGACEEVCIEEAVESVTDDGDVNNETEILLVPQSSDMESIYIVPQDQGHDYLNIQVTEEVITDSWDRTGAEDGVEIPETKVSHDNLLEYDDMEIPLPIDQDSYTNTRPYPCDFCSRRFRKKANLMNHMVAHQTDRPHGCNLCGARYVRKCDLMNHLKTHAYAPSPSRDGLEDEMEDDPVGNQDEESIVKGGNRRKKAATTTPARKRKNNTVAKKIQHEDDPSKPYVCQHCGLGFAREKALASHARVHGGDSPFECTNCGEMFWDVNTLREHMRAKHGAGAMPQSSDHEEFDNDTSYTAADGFGEYYCDTCGVPFHRLDLLKRHRKIHIKPDDNSTNDSTTPHHVCNVCGEWFEEALSLLAHADMHSSRSPSRRCLLCGHRCRDDAEVAEHVRTTHADDLPPNTCQQCGKTCKDKRSLLKHSWVHNADKTFGCSKCIKRFHSKARLRRHMVSHRNKMVTCNECNEEFPDGRALVSHRHSHNKELGGRTFPCRECGKTFGSRSSQQIHLRIHTGERPYGCRFCWKAFADGGTLRKHERIHTGEKPYGCAICPRAFNQRVVLREHVRAHHSGPDPKHHGTMTPYLCKVCGDLFQTSEEVVAHIVAHCDENTALKRQPQNGPRKYKRRRKYGEKEGAQTGRQSGMELLEGNSESDENPKRKLGKRNNKTQQRLNVAEGYQNVLKSFETSMQSLDSIVKDTKASPSKAKGAKKKTKKEDKKATAAAAAAAAAVAAAESQSQSQASRPKMIHTQKTRVPVQIGGEGVKKGQKTKTMVTRTPKVMPGEHKGGIFPGGERNRPRTKNVSYHIEKIQFSPATFKSKDDGEDDDEEQVTLTAPSGKQQRVKFELTLDNIVEQATSNNNGRISSPRKGAQKKSPAAAVKRPKRTTRGQLAAIKMEQLEGLEPEDIDGEMVQQNNNNTVIEDGIVEESVCLEETIAINENIFVVTHVPESILPDNDPQNSNSGDMGYSNDVDVTEKEPPQNILAAHAVIAPVDDVPETIIPDTVEYTCEMCTAVFSTRNELLNHVPIHI